MLDWLFSDPLPVGAAAPDFTLPDQGGQLFTLSSLRGKNVVLVFYPGDDTSVCAKQLCEFRDIWPEVEERNTTVFGINPQSAASHSRFRDKFQYPFPLLVDQRQDVGELYHARGIAAKRTVYLIGPDGIIRFARRGKPNPKEVLNAAVNP